LANKGQLMKDLKRLLQEMDVPKDGMDAAISEIKQIIY
jgi:hypothetical protein